MKKATWLGFSIDDVGLDGYSIESHLERLLAFCEQHELKATLFAVPDDVHGKRMDQRPGYMRLLRDAITRGHEIGQHGLRHDRFEVGIPPDMIMRLPHEGPARKFLAENRETLAREHTVETIRARLRLGRDILSNALGPEIRGFRAPALQVCDPLFAALEAEGYAYDSSTCLQEAGWDLLQGLAHTPREISRARFDGLQTSSAMGELPLTTDYTWYLTRDRFDRTLALAQHDYEACARVGIPFVPVCHVSPIFAGEDGLGLELYRRLFAHMAAHADAWDQPIRSLTLAEINHAVFTQEEPSR